MFVHEASEAYTYLYPSKQLVKDKNLMCVLLVCFLKLVLNKIRRTGVDSSSMSRRLLPYYSYIGIER